MVASEKFCMETPETADGATEVDGLGRSLATILTVLINPPSMSSGSSTMA
jgi:hypothetical protein